MFNHSVVKDRSKNVIVAKFAVPAHAKQYCESLNKSANKKRYHWYETTGSI